MRDVQLGGSDEFREARQGGQDAAEKQRTRREKQSTRKGKDKAGSLIVGVGCILQGSGTYICTDQVSNVTSC